MSQIIENVEAHYETHKVPFGRTYLWHPEHIPLEDDCGEMLTLSATTQNSTRKQAEKVATHAREVVGFLEQARELMVEDNAVQPAIEHLCAALHDAEGRAAMLESWYQRTYSPVSGNSARLEKKGEF